MEVTSCNSDIVSRFGGEEFAILLARMASNGASTIADGMGQTVEQNQLFTRSTTLSTPFVWGAEVDKNMKRI